MGGAVLANGLIVLQYTIVRYNYCNTPAKLPLTAVKSSNRAGFFIPKIRQPVVVMFNKPALAPEQKGFLWPAYLDKNHPHTRTAVVFVIIHHMMLRVSPDTSWRERLFSLFDEFSEIPVENMGLPKY